MEVTVRLFAMLRERAGAGEINLELAEGASVADALAALDEVAGGLPVLLAVNREYAARDQRLAPGDELALIPPVSGGETALVHARVTAEAALARRARRAACATRAPEPSSPFRASPASVERLEYEAYVEMAEERIASIVEEAVERHGLSAAAAEHRVGSVPLSEPSVIVAVSAPHRGEAFAARARDHRPAEGRGADLEEGGRRWRASAGSGIRPELRSLPSVEQLAASMGDVPHGLAVRAARETIAARRASLLAGEVPAGDLTAAAREELDRLGRPRLRAVINATGVIVHTNLGRAPLAEEAVEAVAGAARGYSNLEYDLEAGRRGSRQ